MSLTHTPETTEIPDATDRIETAAGDVALRYTPVCRYADLVPERGVAALVGVYQVALFRLHDGSMHAVSHHDPASGANVMARGLIGSRGTEPTVASPMYKQVYSLVSGQCLDDPELSLAVYPTRVDGDLVTIGLPIRGIDGAP